MPLRLKKNLLGDRPTCTSSLCVSVLLDQQQEKMGTVTYVVQFGPNISGRPLCAWNPCWKADLGEGPKKHHTAADHLNGIKSEWWALSRNLGPPWKAPLPYVISTSRIWSTIAGNLLDSELSSSSSFPNWGRDTDIQFVKPSSKNHFLRSTIFTATPIYWTPPWLGLL